jgi:microcystin-dependent protein
MSDNRDGLDCILQAINNIVEPKVAKLKYDKTYRAKVTQQIDTGLYMVKINNVEYKLPYNGTLNVGDIVKVKAPLNNFSDIYIEALPGGGGGGGGGTTDYNDLTNKPVLNSNYSTSQTPNASEIIKGTISLHKISKTGNYNDLLNKPDLDFIPTSEKGKAGGVATLGTDSKITSTELPNNLVYDSNYVHTDNNFSNTYKDKLESVQEDAQVNVIEKVQKNGIDLDITNKTVNITVPTKTSDLVNDGEDGTNPYITGIPIASETVLGGIKVGDNLTINSDGVLSAQAGGVKSYNDLTDKPVLNTNISESQPVSSNETISGTISLHKISKTGDYSDLNNLPSLDFIPNSEKGVAGGVATLGTDSKITSTELPNNLVYDSNYVHTDNNFSNTYKDKLESVQEDAQVNVIEKVQKNGIDLDITNKTVNITVPTKTSDLVNDGEDGTNPYITGIPIASETVLGGIKVGDNLTINSDGVLSAQAGGVKSYNDLTDKPVLNTNISESQPVSSNETISGTISLHKISKTGDYSDLNNLPSLDFIPNSEKGVAGGVATLGNDTKISDNQLPIATTTDLGVIKVGTNLTISEDGTLNATGGSGGTVSDTLPIGSVVKWFSTTIPTNWLACNGQAISRTEYAELFAVIGTKYGSGDGNTTFNLPNIKGKTTVGLDIDDTDFNTLGKTGGEKIHTLIENEIPKMNVYMTRANWYDHGGLEAGGAVNRVVVAGGASGGTTDREIGTVNGGGQAHNNLQPYIVSNYIIKAKQTQAVVATVVDNLTSESSTDALSANQGKVLDSKKIEADNIKAGENITLSVDGKNITINSTGGGSGAEEVEIGNTEPIQDTIELWVDTSEQGTGSSGVEQIEYGNITAAQMTNASIGGQDGKIYELTFQNSYSTPPTVITNFYSEQGISYYGFVATQVVALSNTKCTLCVFVQGLTGSKCGISYMVKGK